MNDALAEQAELIFYGNGNFSTLFQRVKLTNERGPDGRTHRGRGRETAPIQPDDIVSKVAKFSVETGKERRGRRMHFHSLVVVEHDVLVNTAGAWGLTMNKDAIKTAFNSLRLRILVPEARGGDIISRLKVDFIRSHDQVENYLLKDQISYTLRRLDAAKLKRLLEEEDEALNEVLEEEKTDGEQAAVIDSEANEDIGAITDLLKDLGL